MSPDVSRRVGALRQYIIAHERHTSPSLGSQPEIIRVSMQHVLFFKAVAVTDLKAVVATWSDRY